MTPSPAGLPGFHHAALLGQHPSWAFNPALTGVSCLSTLHNPSVASLVKPGLSVHHGLLPALCLVLMEHSLCLGPMPRRMCAPQRQSFTVEALIPFSEYSTHSLQWVCQGFWNSPSWPSQVKVTLLLPLFHARNKFPGVWSVNWPYLREAREQYLLAGVLCVRS